MPPGTRRTPAAPHRPTGARPDALSESSNATGSSNSAVFIVTLSAPSGRTVTVQAQTANGAGATGATAGVDYTSTSLTLTFAPGDTVKTVTVPIIGDVVDEADEAFTVTLSGAVNGTLTGGKSVGVGTIVDDDGAARR